MVESGKYDEIVWEEKIPYKKERKFCGSDHPGINCGELNVCIWSQPLSLCEAVGRSSTTSQLTKSYIYIQSDGKEGGTIFTRTLHRKVIHIQHERQTKKSKKKEDDYCLTYHLITFQGSYLGMDYRNPSRKLMEHHKYPPYPIAATDSINTTEYTVLPWFYFLVFLPPFQIFRFYGVCFD